MTGMCIYGMVHAVHIYTTRYEVPSKKDAHLKIALVADLHLGYSIGSHQMEEMVEKINAEEPDVVVIAGDILIMSTMPSMSRTAWRIFWRA